MADSVDGSASQWRESEVLDLIRIWGDGSIQAKLEVSYRNRAVFESISKDMAERGHRRTWLQCQRKVKSLKAKFKETKDYNKVSGRVRIICPFHDELDRILGDKPSVQPLELLDSSVDTPEDKDHVFTDGASSASSFSDNADKTPASLPCKCEDAGESSSGPSGDKSVKNSASATPARATPGRSRKRKTKMEATLDVFAEKITSALKADDSDLLLKMQASQQEHDLKMLNVLTQFMDRAQRSPQPLFYQPAVHPSDEIKKEWDTPSSQEVLRKGKDEESGYLSSPGEGVSTREEAERRKEAESTSVLLDHSLEGAEPNVEGLFKGHTTNQNQLISDFTATFKSFKEQLEQQFKKDEAEFLQSDKEDGQQVCSMLTTLNQQFLQSEEEDRQQVCSQLTTLNQQRLSLVQQCEKSMTDQLELLQENLNAISTQTMEILRKRKAEQSERLSAFLEFQSKCKAMKR